MTILNRRKFITKGALGLGAVASLSQFPANLFAGILPGISEVSFGFQSFPIRDLIAKDFAGTLKLMAGLGYQYVEMCSPSGYSSIGFGQLVSMKPEDMRGIINEAGLTCPSCHFTFVELKNQLDERIAFAKKLGLSQMVCSSFWLPSKATLKDYLDAADTLNKIAEKIKQAGMQTGYHNHDMEFVKLDDTLIYDALMGQLDPHLVQMQFQTQVITLGYKASTYFTKYPGRFISSHLSDWTPDKKEVPIGQGIIDWKDFFSSAKIGGVKNFFVEMNMDKFKDSAAFIKGM